MRHPSRTLWRRLRNRLPAHRRSAAQLLQLRYFLGAHLLHLRFGPFDGQQVGDRRHSGADTRRLQSRRRYQRRQVGVRLLLPASFLLLLQSLLCPAFGLLGGEPHFGGGLFLLLSHDLLAQMD